MEHQYYKEYYDLERKHWWFTARENILSQYVSKLLGDSPQQQQVRILNIGCGTGRSSEYLSKFGHVVSIEYDKFCCEFASEKTGLEIINGSITELPFEDGSFDFVCAFDVIEHVEDDLLAVTEMKRVTRKGGQILITVPAFMSLWSHHDVINHHFRRYREIEIKKLFAVKNDGKMIFSSYFNFFLFPPIYLFRRLSNVLKNGEKRSGSGSDFEAFKPGISNGVLHSVMKTEAKFLNRHIKLPFGVSIIYSWKKH